VGKRGKGGDLQKAGRTTSPRERSSLKGVFRSEKKKKPNPAKKSGGGIGEVLEAGFEVKEKAQKERTITEGIGKNFREIAQPDCIITETGWNSKLGDKGTKSGGRNSVGRGPAILP